MAIHPYDNIDQLSITEQFKSDINEALKMASEDLVMIPHCTIETAIEESDNILHFKVELDLTHLKMCHDTDEVMDLKERLTMILSSIAAAQDADLSNKKSFPFSKIPEFLYLGLDTGYTDNTQSTLKKAFGI